MSELDWVWRALDVYLALAGVAGSCVLCVVIGYAALGLVRAGKLGRLVGLALCVTLLFFPYGRYFICLAGLVVAVANGGFYLFYFARSFRKKPLRHAGPRDLVPRVAVLIPAKNEAAVIEDTLRALGRLDHPRDRLEVVVIDDCSTDATARICEQLSPVVPNLRVRRNASPLGKAAGMNAAVAALECDYFVVLDADHHVDPGFLEVGLSAFDDPRVACTQGRNAVRNPRESLLCALVEMEYLARFRGCYPGRDMAFFMGSGGIFRTADFRAVGGFEPDALTEDLDISFRLYAHGKTLAYDERIGTDELATATLRSWFWQRHRWFRGIWQTFSRHFRRVALPDGSLGKLRLPVVHFAVECMFLPVLTVLTTLYALDRAGLGEFPFKPLLYAGLGACLVVFSGGYVRGGRAQLLALNPLFTFYLLLYSLPASIAWVDNVLLDRPYVWRQTLRSARPEEEAGQVAPAPAGGAAQSNPGAVLSE